MVDIATEPAGLGLDDIELDTSGRYAQASPAAGYPAQQSKWLQVSNLDPCAICGSKRKCTKTDDGSIAKCTKIVTGSFKSTTDDVGPAHYHQLKENWPIPTWLLPEAPAETPLSVSPLDRPLSFGSDFVHKVYATLLSTSRTIEPHHMADLKRRGLTEEQALNNGYRTINRNIIQNLAGFILRQFGDDVYKVPGFSKWPDGRPKIYYPHIKTPSEAVQVQPVLLVPVRNAAGQILAIKIRIDDPDWDGAKYLWLSSAKTGGQKANSAVHVPKGTPAVCESVRVTEGELKADVCFALDDHPIISIPGVSSHAKAMAVLTALGAKHVSIAFDADCRTNRDVAKALRKFYRSLIKAGFEVSIEHWDIEDGKGLDDLLVGGKIPNIATGQEAEDLLAEIMKSAGVDSKETLPEGGEESDAKRPLKPKIYCLFDEMEVNNMVEGYLSKVPTIFQRGCVLVKVVRGSKPSPGIVRSANAPTIQAIPEAGLREILSSIITFEDMGKEGPEIVRVPGHVTKALHQRGEWENVRPLEAVVSYPVIRADGSIASTPGYDPATGLFLFVPEGLVSVPDAPTFTDAQAALVLLRELVADFPFQCPGYLTCWLAMLLTPLARYAFGGPTPLFMIDANTPGSGKTLLAEIFSKTVTGDDFAKLAPCREDDEMRKRITSIAMRGDPLILLDNVAGDLGSPSFDAALTSTSWTDRILGASRQVTLPLYCVWVATGNNIVLAADTTRRVCHIRLVSPEERPEERTGFRHPNILEHVAQHRSELLSAALTILAAYFRAGRPKVPMKQWGSFEGWSSVVRQALIWLGEPDPAELRKELIENSDSNSNALHDLIAAWQAYDRDSDGKTVTDVLNFMHEFDAEGDPKGSTDRDLRMKVRNAVSQICNTSTSKPPSAVSFGKFMKKFRGRVIGGKCFDYRENGDKVKVWKVLEAKKPEIAAIPEIF